MKTGWYMMLWAVIIVLPGRTEAVPEDLAADESYIHFMQRMVEEHGFKRQYLDEIFADAGVSQRVLDAISRPAEKKPWHEYRKIFLTQKRIDGGVDFWRAHAGLLESASERWGVPPEIITAIIGVETLYGRHKGRIPVLDALVTLGFRYPPRAKFFRSELEHYLLLTREQGIDPRSLKGSYAGAMGMPQFISSSYRHYAVDFDEDGQKNLWDNTADVIGSVASYFSKHGWQEGAVVTTRAAVSGSAHREIVDAGIRPAAGMAELAAADVTVEGWDGSECPCALIELENEGGSEYWVAAKNFYVITRYNHSALYAMAVYQLAGRIRDAYAQH